METQQENSKPRKSRRPPATSPEARENELTSLAMDVVEKQLRDGTASSQVLVHFLKAASSQARLEREKLRLTNNLLVKKATQIDNTENAEILYKEALEAMRSYGGQRESL